MRMKPELKPKRPEPKESKQARKNGKARNLFHRKCPEGSLLA